MHEYEIHLFQNFVSMRSYVLVTRFDVAFDHIRD